MFSRFWRFCAIPILACLALPAQAQIIFNPANGHYYEAVPANNPTWQAAREAAAARIHEGLTGYLATLTSVVENDFITTNFPQATLGGYWLGAFQPSGSIEPSGGFQWVTGEEWEYTNWYPGEPNNYNSEDALQLVPTKEAHVPEAAAGQWNDLTGSAAVFIVDGYVVEYAATVPEPGALLTMLAGTTPGVFLLLRRRNRKRMQGAA